MLEIIEAGQMEALEAAWIQAVEEGLALAGLAEVLAALSAAGELDAAETLGWELLAERTQQLAGAELLEVAKAVISAVPDSDELRSQAEQLYRETFAGHDDLAAIMNSAGLLAGQSPRRAFRTLDTCLAIGEGSYLANRFDHQVIRVAGYDDALGEFEAVDAHGRTVRLEPKHLADEFDPADERDFRVLRQHHPEQVRQQLEDRPADALVAICMSAGGQIDANALKEMLVPAHIPADKWSGWWNRARTAAKRSEQLSLSGRPIVVSYHTGGRSLEEELADAAAAAATSLERLAVLRQYAREVRVRKLPVEGDFAGPIVDAMADRARSPAGQRPVEALAAALAVEAAGELGMPAPRRDCPGAAAVLADADNPAEVVAQLADPTLWPAALDALDSRPDAADQMTVLLAGTPAGLLDHLTARLIAAGRQEAVAAIVTDALTDPDGHLEICLWLWAGPADAPPGTPGKVELLHRLLNVLRRVDMDLNMPREAKKQIRQRVRSALSAETYGVYRRAVDEMDDAVASTVKNLIVRAHGLGESVPARMLDLLRERFYSLFAKSTVEPWLDENAIWTTQAALHRREEKLKHLTEIKMAENARAIGAAAEHGDLSENSEWRFAIEERDLLRAQALKIQTELAQARIIDPHRVSTDSVAIGSRIRLMPIGGGETIRVDLLGPWDSDVDNHVYNYQTPLAQALLGKAVGDEATLKLGGQEAAYRIERLGSALE